MDKEKISVYDYSDYRLFLRDYYLKRKETDKKFSHRYIAIHTGASSSGWFADIINNRINLTRQYLTALCKLSELAKMLNPPIKPAQRPDRQFRYWVYFQE